MKDRSAAISVLMADSEPLSESVTVSVVGGAKWGATPHTIAVCFNQGWIIRTEYRTNKIW